MTVAHSLGTTLTHWLLLGCGYVLVVVGFVMSPSPLPPNKDPDFQAALSAARDSVYNNQTLPFITEQLLQLDEAEELYFDSLLSEARITDTVEAFMSKSQSPVVTGLIVYDVLGGANIQDALEVGNYLRSQVLFPNGNIGVRFILAPINIPSWDSIGNSTISWANYVVQENIGKNDFILVLDRWDGWDDGTVIQTDEGNLVYWDPSFEKDEVYFSIVKAPTYIGAVHESLIPQYISRLIQKKTQTPPS